MVLGSHLKLHGRYLLFKLLHLVEQLAVLQRKLLELLGQGLLVLLSLLLLCLSSVVLEGLLLQMGRALEFGWAD